MIQRNESAEQNVKWFESDCESHSVMSDSLRPHGLYSPWNSPGPNTGVDRHYFLHGIFPTQGSNPARSPALQEDSLPLSHRESPKRYEVLKN